MRIVISHSLGRPFHLSPNECRAIAETKGWEVAEGKHPLSDLAETMGWDEEELEDDSGEYLVFRESPGEEWKDLCSDTFRREDPQFVQHVLSADTGLQVIDVPDEWDWALFADCTGLEWIIESGHCWPSLDAEAQDQPPAALASESQTDSGQGLQVVRCRYDNWRRFENGTWYQPFLTPEEVQRVAELKGLTIAQDSNGSNLAPVMFVDPETGEERPYAFERHDPAFVTVAEETGRFEILQIPAGTDYLVLLDSDYCELMVERGYIRPDPAQKQSK